MGFGFCGLRHLVDAWVNAESLFCSIPLHMPMRTVLLDATVTGWTDIKRVGTNIHTCVSMNLVDDVFDLRGPFELHLRRLKTQSRIG